MSLITPSPISLLTAAQPNDPNHASIPQVETASPMLVFRLCDRVYALAIPYVVQIIPMLKLTSVPQVEHVIEGLANIHGKILPVLSARRHLGLPVIAPKLDTPIIILQTDERTIGFVVDEVVGVEAVFSNQITDPAVILPEGFEKAEVLQGIIYRGHQVILVLNPNYLLRPTQIYALNREIAALPDHIFPQTEPGSSEKPTHSQTCSVCSESPLVAISEQVVQMPDCEERKNNGLDRRKSRKGRKKSD